MKTKVYSLLRYIVKSKYHTLKRFGDANSDLYRSFKLHRQIYTKMPRVTDRVLDIQRLRQKIKGKSVKYAINGNVSLQVLGTGAYGTSKCVYLLTNNTSYIFNCGEGTQRLAHEHKYKLVKTDHVFITAAHWDNLGGIPGMLLTLQDTGIPRINLHAPKGTMGIFDAIKTFVLLQNLVVYEAACNESLSYSDHVMTVSYVILTKSNVQETKSTNEEKVADNTTNFNSNGTSNKNEQKNQLENLKKVFNKQKVSTAMSFICKLHSRPGTLSLEKCVEKGVTPGPLFGQLKAGQDITLPNGNVVCSKDVCSPPTPGPVFIIVECPSKDYLESFVNHTGFAQHQEPTLSENDIPCCVIHFTCQEIMDDPRYVDWMKRFNSKTRHIVINEENECIGSEACYRHQYKLHMLHPEIFPLLNEEFFQKKTQTQDLYNIHRPRTHHSVLLQPELNFKTENEVWLHPKEYKEEVYENEGFSEVLAELQANIDTETKISCITNDYPKIVMLGTGSSIPNKIRNTSAILLRLDETHSMLLDCGEGTFGQLVRLFGKSETKNILKTIKAIYVSHLHADHHIGLINLLKQRGKVILEPLYLFAPAHISRWLHLYHKCFESILHELILIPNNELFLNVHVSEDNKYKDMYQTLNVQALKTVYVKHCLFSYGISIELKNGKKIVYSGDTMPCENLVKLGENCDLLIHEATMEDDLEKEAALKYHSTVSQAIEIGEQMKSKFTLLTHFSQRYSSIPHLPQTEDATKLHNVGIAYDNMTVSMSQLSLLPLLYPTLKVMFNKHYLELEERAAKRQRLITQ